MTEVEKKQLVTSYQEDYQMRTGEHLKVIPCSRWEASASFCKEVSFWKLVQIVLDFTGWQRKEVYTRIQSEEKVFRRALIDFIAVNNGCSYNSCARFTGRDHTTVIHSVTRFENRLETELHTRRYFYEVIRYIKENYHLYKDRNITDQDIT